MTYTTMLYIGIGAFFGANGRYILGMWASKFTSKFPLGTLLVNIIGSFILGVFVIALNIYQVDPMIVTMLTVGFCGSFTTFSSFSVDTYKLLEKNVVMGLINILLNVLLSLMACAIGWYIGSS